MKNEQPEGQKTTDDYTHQEKDSLTESDIKAVEEKLVNQFNSELLKLAEDVIKSPPTVNTINSIYNRLSNISTFGWKTVEAINSLKGLKLD